MISTFVYRRGITGGDYSFRRGSWSAVISTFVYRRGITGGDYSFAAAAGLFNSVINLTLILLVNRMSKQLTGTSLW